MISQHFAAICTCPPSYWGRWAEHYLCAANQGMQLKTGCPSKGTHGHKPKRSDRGRVVVGNSSGQQPHCTATLSTQHRRGVLDGCKDLCQHRSKLAGKPIPKMNKIIWENSQEGADWGPSRPSTCLSHLRFSFTQGITVLMLHHQAGGMKVADSAELTLDDPRVPASLKVFCTFLSLHELQPDLSETLVSCAQQGRCKINRIWSAARDLTRLQRLWYFTEAQNKNQLLLEPSVCYWFYF